MTDAERMIVDLWIAMFGEPPPVHSEVPIMVRALVESLGQPSRLIDNAS